MTARLYDPVDSEPTPISVEVYADVVLLKHDSDDDADVWGLVEVTEGKLAVEIGGERFEWSIADGGRV